MPKKQKQNKAAKLNVAGMLRLNAEVFRKKAAAINAATAAAPAARAAADIATPTGETKELTNFPYPVVGEDGVLIGYENIDATVFSWRTQQFDRRIHWEYRPDGTTGPGSWLKPPIVAENSQLGMAAIVLPSGEYEYLSLPGA